MLPTKVVCLTQVVTVDELKDDEEYEDILEDMRTEGGKYGKILSSGGTPEACSCELSQGRSNSPFLQVVW